MLDLKTAVREAAKIIPAKRQSGFVGQVEDAFDEITEALQNGITFAAIAEKGGFSAPRLVETYRAIERKKAGLTWKGTPPKKAGHFVSDRAAALKAELKPGKPPAAPPTAKSSGPSGSDNPVGIKVAARSDRTMTDEARAIYAKRTVGTSGNSAYDDDRIAQAQRETALIQSGRRSEISEK
jgi:hypothetical protein